MSNNKPVIDPNRKPRRGLTAEERTDLFREFKLGLCAFAALVILVTTLCWDRGRPATARPTAPQPRKANLTAVWHPAMPPDHAIPPLPPEPPRGEGAPAPIIRPAPLPPAPPDHLVPPAPPAPAPGREYIVKKGDNPWKIARKTLGDSRKAQLIVDANPGLDPKKLKIGTVLRLPPAGAPAALPLPGTGHGHTAMVSATVPAEAPDASGDGTQIAQAPPSSAHN